MCPLPTRMILDLWSPRDLWVDHLLKSWGRYQEMHFCSCLSRFFSFFPPSSHRGLSSEIWGWWRAMLQSPMSGWLSLTTSTFSAGEVAATTTTTTPLPPLPPPRYKQPTDFPCINGWIYGVSWYAVHRTFCSVTDVQLVVNWRGKKIRMIYAATMLSQIFLNHNF